MIAGGVFVFCFLFFGGEVASNGNVILYLNNESGKKRYMKHKNIDVLCCMYKGDTEKHCMSTKKYK